MDIVDLRMAVAFCADMGEALEGSEEEPLEGVEEGERTLLPKDENGEDIAEKKAAEIGKNRDPIIVGEVDEKIGSNKA